jgi:outer membrane protein TolC
MTPAQKKINFNYTVPKKYKNTDTEKSRSENQGKKKINYDKINWWKDFDDGNLRKIIKSVIDNNIELSMALENINILRAQYGISQVKKMPIVSLNGGASVSRSPFMTFNFDRTTQKGERVYEPKVNDTYNLKLGAMFELDLFGKYESLTKSALSNIDSSVSDSNPLLSRTERYCT